MDTVQLPEAATEPATINTQLTATVPPSGKTSPTGKPRGFVMPQTADASNGTTTKVEPSDAAAAHDCPALNGQCRECQNDHGDAIHLGPESIFPVGPEAELPPFQLAQFGDDEPQILFGNGAIPLDIDATAALIRQVGQYGLRLADARQHLISAVQQHRLDHGTPLAVVRSEWERVRLDHNPDKPAGGCAYSPAGLMRPIAAVEYNQDTTTPDDLRAYLDKMVGPHRVEYTSRVADALDGFEAIRRNDPDPKALEFWDEVEQQVIASDDPVVCVADIARLLAAEELAKFISQHDGQIFTRPPENDSCSWAARVHGRLTVVVPEDHDPILTLSLVREQVARTDGAK